MSFAERLSACRVRADGYFRSQAMDAGEAVFWRNSPAHDAKASPGHLLYGSWAGILGSALIRSSVLEEAALRDAMAAGLNRFQGPDGLFRIAGIPTRAMGGHDDEYFSFHCTNYALGALDMIERAPRFPLAFLERFLEPGFTRTWLDSRNWAAPWTEGNTVVNLASFFELEARRGRDRAREGLLLIADWLERRQDPRTGFWNAPGVAYLPAMAGAAHLLHVFHVLGRDVPNAGRILDSCLERGYPGIRGACADIDLVDILCHLRSAADHVRAIDDILRRFLAELLQIQNEDGGFCDSYVTPLETYGLVTPRRTSATWTTWFRLATLGMIAVTLLPGEAPSWRFRRTVGSGFFQPRAGAASSPVHAPASPALGAAREIRLAAVRRTRFWRQHLTWRIRKRLRSMAG